MTAEGSRCPCGPLEVQERRKALQACLRPGGSVPLKHTGVEADGSRSRAWLPTPHAGPGWKALLGRPLCTHGAHTFLGDRSLPSRASPNRANLFVRSREGHGGEHTRPHGPAGPEVSVSLQVAPHPWHSRLGKHTSAFGLFSVPSCDQFSERLSCFVLPESHGDANLKAESALLTVPLTEDRAWRLRPHKAPSPKSFGAVVLVFLAL